MIDPSAADPRTGLAQSRTGFAAFRTHLALDRTTMAWVRTALTMSSFGFGLVGFFRSVSETSPSPENILHHQTAIRFGIALIVLAAIATILAAASHWRNLERLRNGDDLQIPRLPLSLVIAVVLALATLIGLAALLL